MGEVVMGYWRNRPQWPLVAERLAAMALAGAGLAMLYGPHELTGSVVLLAAVKLWGPKR